MSNKDFWKFIIPVVFGTDVIWIGVCFMLYKLGVFK
jgi:hypothetical protein